jgi:hypothetical protein
MPISLFDSTHSTQVLPMSTYGAQHTTQLFMHVIPKVSNITHTHTHKFGQVLTNGAQQDYYFLFVSNLFDFMIKI